VRGGALQGYLVDLPTAEALGIDDLGDLAEPEIAAAFDTDGDGRAELIGCETGWACGAIVDHHLGAYGLDDTVEQVRGDYGPLMEATAARAEAGQSALFYTFTPNWTTGELVPGRGVIWLPVPFASLPADLAEQETLIEVPDIEGCPLDPCALGFAPNDIRAVASRSFLGEHPAIEALLTELTIPLEDISNQNARMMEEAVIPRPSRGCRSPSAPRTSPCSTC
jgi:glycine betaine/proline transport system substrate-binding protein